jgi:hypothetical protein
MRRLSLDHVLVLFQNHCQKAFLAGKANLARVLLETCRSDGGRKSKSSETWAT